MDPKVKPWSTRKRWARAEGLNETVVCISATYDSGSVACGRILGQFGVFRNSNNPKSTPNDPYRTSDNLKLEPHKWQPHPEITDEN